MATRVLVVEDIPEVRTVVRVDLRRREGFEVVGEAATGAEAVRLTSSLRPDIVLLDLKLPDLSDRELFRSVRDACETSKVVVMTAYDQDWLWYRARGVRVVPKERIDEVVDAMAGLT